MKQGIAVVIRTELALMTLVVETLNFLTTLTNNHLKWVSHIMADPRPTYLRSVLTPMGSGGSGRCISNWKVRTCCLSRHPLCCLLILIFFKPQITVAICCQGDQTTTRWSFMAHVLSSTLQSDYMVQSWVRCGWDVFWLVVNTRRILMTPAQTQFLQ